MARRQTQRPRNQSTVSEETSPAISENPAIAAWFCGRLLNQARFHAVQAWLLGVRAQADLVARSMQQLAWMVRSLSGKARDKDAVRDCVHVRLAEWQREYSSPSRRRAIASAEQHIEESGLEYEETGTVNDLRDAYCRNAACAVEAMFAELALSLETVLTQHGKAVFRLGRFVDQLVHPLYIWRWMYPPVEGGIGTSRRLDSANSPTLLLGTPEANAAMSQCDSPPPLHIPRNEVQAVNQPLDDVTRREISNRWRDLGLSPASLPISCQPADDASAAQTASVADELDRVLREVLPTLTSPVVLERITVDIDRLTAVFDGTSYPLNTADLARFLWVIVQANGNWVAPDDFAREFRELDGVRLDRLRNRLPEALASLIQSKTGSGYRLVIPQNSPGTTSP